MGVRVDLGPGACIHGCQVDWAEAMGGMRGGGMGSPRLAAIWPDAVVGANMDLEVAVERGQAAADVSLCALIAHKTSVNPPPRHSHDARPRSGAIHA